MTKWTRECGGFVSSALDAAIAQIERAPHAWPPYDLGSRRVLLHRYPYHPVYRADSRRIVVAVAHTPSPALLA